MTVYYQLHSFTALKPPLGDVVCLECERTDAMSYYRTRNKHWLCAACVNQFTFDQHAPYISLMPGRLGGAPTLSNTRLSTDVLAGFAESNGVESACDNYGVTPADVACVRWFERTWRLALRKKKEAI